MADDADRCPTPAPAGTCPSCGAPRGHQHSRFCEEADTS